MDTEKILFITDTHQHPFTEFSKPLDNFINDRFKEQLDVLQKSFDLARKNNATLVHGGDLFHKRGAVGTEVFNLVFNVFKNNPDVPTILMRGNHDSVTNSLYSESSIVPFGALPNVTTIEVPTAFTYGEEVNIYFLPYGDEKAEMINFINDIKPSENKKSILFGHIGVNGAVSGTSSFKLGGEFTLDELRPDVFEYILLGHYHKKQILGGDPKHLYGGALMQQSFSDEGYTPGAHLIDIKKNTLTFIPIESRMFHTIKGTNIPENIEEIIAKDFVRFVGTPEEAGAMDKLVKEDSLTNVRVMVEKSYNTQIRLTNIDSSSSPLEITESYVDTFYPDSKKEALECIKEAMLT